MSKKVDDDVDTHLNGLHVLLRFPVPIHPATVDITWAVESHDAACSSFEHSVRTVRNSLHVWTAILEIVIDVEYLVVVGDFPHRVVRKELVEEKVITLKEPGLIFPYAVIGKYEPASFKEFPQVLLLPGNQFEVSFGGHEDEWMAAHIVEVLEAYRLGFLADIDVSEFRKLLAQDYVAYEINIPAVYRAVID